MKRTITLLSFLLLLQIGLALLLVPGPGGRAARHGGALLLSLAASAPDRLILSEASGASLTLAKEAGRWVMPEQDNLPAATDKIDSLLNTLADLQRPWPVADSASSLKRFKVAEDAFERKIVVQQDGQPLATLLLGSAPGFRKVHARPAGEKQVFDIPFDSYRASVKPNDWLDRTLLHSDAQTIDAIGLADGTTLTRRDGRLQLEQTAGGEQTDPERAEQLLQAVAGLSVQDMADQAQRPDAKTAPDWSCDIRFGDGRTRTLRLTKMGEQDGVLLQVSDLPQLFRVGPTLLTRLQGFTRASLTKTADATPTAP